MFVNCDMVTGVVLLITPEPVSNRRREYLTFEPLQHRGGVRHQLRYSRQSLPRCSICGQEMDISPVNVSRCTNVGGNWLSIQVCRNKTCRHTELSEKSIREWRGK